MKRVLWMIALMIGMWSSWAFGVWRDSLNGIHVTLDTAAEWNMWDNQENNGPELLWEQRLFLMWLAGFKPSYTCNITVMDDGDNVSFVVWTYSAESGIHTPLAQVVYDKAEYAALRKAFRKDVASYKAVLVEEESND